LRPRVAFAGPVSMMRMPAEAAGSLVLKFREGTRVRIRQGRLTPEVDRLSAADAGLLRRAALRKEQVAGEVEAVRQALKAEPNLRVTRLFRRPEVELDREKIAGERARGEELADLNLYYEVTLPAANPLRTAQLLRRLLRSGIVETAYPQPRP